MEWRILRPSTQFNTRKNNLWLDTTLNLLSQHKMFKKIYLCPCGCEGGFVMKAETYQISLARRHCDYAINFTIS
jgi:hypothetical protein